MCVWGSASELTETVVLVALVVGGLPGRGGALSVSLLLSIEMSGPVACRLAQLPGQGPVFVVVHASTLRRRGTTEPNQL